MADSFSATSSVAAGFRLIRDKPRVVAIWTLAALVFSIAVAAFAWYSVGKDVLTVFGDSTRNAEALQSFFQRLMALYAIIGLPLIAGYVLLTTAVLRAMLHPADEGFAYFRLGMEEVRLFGFWLGRGLAMMIPFGALVFLIVVVAAGAGLSVNESLLGLKILIIIALVLAIIVGLIWIVVRTALIPAAIVANHRLDLAHGWRLTRGRFWLVLGLILLLVLIAWAIEIAASLVTQPIMLMGLAPALQQLQTTPGGQPDAQAFWQAMAGLWPLLAILVVISIVVAVLRLVITQAPYADAYRRIVGPKPEDSASAFD